MTTIHHERLTVIDTTSNNDPDETHLVCHCTDDNLAACGFDASTSPWCAPDAEEVPCPLCYTAWPAGAPTCPWGCNCDECGPDEEFSR